jgi:hypothetical protein
LIFQAAEHRWLSINELVQSTFPRLPSRGTSQVLMARLWAVAADFNASYAHVLPEFILQIVFLLCVASRTRKRYWFKDAIVTYNIIRFVRSL